MRIRFLLRIVHAGLAVVILGPALVSARPPNAQRNYGMLGNVLASLAELLRGRFGSYDEKVDGAVVAMRGTQAKDGKKNKKRGYGPLGRLLVNFIGESLGYSFDGGGSRAVSVQDGEPQKSFLVIPPEGAAVSAAEISEAPAEKPHTGSSRQRLQSLRELLKVLWSNFLPDPTFDRAVERLKERDVPGLDMVSESGSYITAAQREQLLTSAGECTSDLCVSPTMFAK